jgi:hypothetical protein
MLLAVARDSFPNILANCDSDPSEMGIASQEVTGDPVPEILNFPQCLLPGKHIDGVLHGVRGVESNDYLLRYKHSQKRQKIGSQPLNP